MKHHDVPNEFQTEVTYRLLERIATGGMGAVYKAEAIGAAGFRRTVALKVVLKNLVSDERFVEMFLDEARLVAILNHENIIQIHHLGREDFGHFIVMEYARGVDLHTVIDTLRQDERRVPLDIACFVVSQVARGLHYAHRKRGPEGQHMGIVHRDVCPGNILLTLDGLPKISDFGIAKALLNHMPAHDACLMGKLIYMAPEQARRHVTDRRSDIYALGMVFYEMLTGIVPRTAESEGEMLDLASAGAVDLSLLGPEIPQRLEGIIVRCLQLDPSDRYQTAGTLAAAIENFSMVEGYGSGHDLLERFLAQEFTMTQMQD